MKKDSDDIFMDMAERVAASINADEELGKVWRSMTPASKEKLITGWFEMMDNLYIERSIGE